MVEIDDAGSGSLIGGTCIGMIDTNTNNYYYDIIPLELYKDEIIKEKKYLDYVIKIVNKGLKIFKYNEKDKIRICQGYMFEKLRTWLTHKNFNWENAVITGLLQEKVEKSFENYTIDLGFPKSYIKYTKYPFHFHRILKWVYADYENRQKLCKTGWNSWKKYGNLDLNIKNDYVKECDRKYFCLKCGKKLNLNKKVQIISYTSDRPTMIYIHQKC